MIVIKVISVSESEQVRGKFTLSVRVSNDEYHEDKSITVFRYFLRGEPFCSTVPMPGEDITEDELDALYEAEENTAATVRALNMLAFGDNTAKGLADKLRQKKVSKSAADAAVTFCLEKGYIREEEYLHRFMQTLCEKKLYGQKRIRAEVYKKRFSEDVVRTQFSTVCEELDFAGALDRRISKMGRDAFSTPEKQKKSIAALMRYGFSFDEIKRAMN